MKPGASFFFNSCPVGHHPLGVLGITLSPIVAWARDSGLAGAVLGLLTLTVFTSSAGASSFGDSTYLGELVGRAAEARLAEEREWHLFLHYRRNLLGGYTSEADDPGFFLAPTGKTDPQAELEATLARFFSDDLVGRSRQPAQCAFIARYHWLKAKLGFDDGRLPPLRCERFDAWLAELAPASVTLIFPAAFMNNPASMFGHTFLRIDQQGQTEHTRILAYTINYAADVTTDNGFAFALLGITGGFKGYFSTIPYYLKVQEYRDIENRDIWEYRLNLTDEQILRMMRHAWELGNAYYDYFFFKENCAYHILSLLEVADPTLHITDQFIFWTIPADTVRLLTRHPGLVGDISYRPSRSTQIKRKREALTSLEQRWMDRIIRDPASIDTEEFRQFTPERRAFVLDTVSDYLRYRTVGEEERMATYKDRNRQVLLERSALRVRSEPFLIRPFTAAPEQGHETSRAGVGIGWRNNDLFEEVTIRAGYHDLLDPEQGYTPDAQIELLRFSVRHYERQDQTRLERFTLANILSLSPINKLFQAPSWKISAGMQTLRHKHQGEDCRLCSNGFVNGGIGAAVESRLIRREVYFAFGEVEANVSGAYEEHHRAGGGGTVGFLTDLTDRWRIMASTTYLRFPLGEQSDDFRFFVGQRYQLGKDLAVRAEYHHRDHDNDVVFSLQAYF